MAAGPIRRFTFECAVAAYALPHPPLPTSLNASSFQFIRLYW